MAEAVRKEYETSLSDLTFNSKPLINMLTMLAEENVKHAREIVQVIETRLQKAKPSEKLPNLYLTDSIIKNMRGAYLEAFTPNIIHTFCGVFEKVDEKTRQALFKLRMTWSSYFSPKKLYALDLKVQELDPAWPIVADPTASQPAAIHVNPKFIKKQPKTTEAPKTSTTTSKPTTSSTSVKLSALELTERKKKESERQEIEMRQQLIKKQEQLLQLQQKRLEFELQQTQNKLAVQALELKQKDKELHHQQQALQHQQQQAAAQQQHAAAAAAAAAVASWSPAMPQAMLPPPQPPMMWPSGPPHPHIMPGYEAPRMQQQSFLPPPPVPPFNLGQPPSMPQQQPMPPMQPVLPVQQVPPVPQALAPVKRDPRVARDPRLARRDPRLRGAPQLPVSTPAPTPQTALAVATVPPVQSTAQMPVVSVAPPKSKPPATSTKTAPSETTQKLKSIVTVASSQPSVTTSKSSVQVASVVQVAKASDLKQPPVEKQESKSETKSNKKDTTLEKRKTNSKVSSEPSLLAQFKVEVEEKLNKSKEAKEAKSSERSPRRDEERDVGSDSKSRDRSSREPERRLSKDSKKDFDKRDSWSKDRDSRERDSREKDRDYRPREIARPVNSRRRANRSRSRSRSPVLRRSHSPRSDKSRTVGNKVDKFGRDMPRPVKENKEEKTVEPARKDIDERPKARRSSKENVLDIKDDKVTKSEKRPSPSRISDKETETKAAEEAPSKRRRLDEEMPAKRKASSLSPPKTVPEREREKLSKDKRHEDELGSLRSKKSAEELRTLKELGPLHLGGKSGLGRDRRHTWDIVEYERELLSPSGRREKPLPRRRLSIDPSVHIPKELSYEKHAFILEQAEKQLNSGELTHQQHQDLLRELFVLHKIQKQRKEEEFVKRHPEDPHLRRHFLDDARMGYDSRRRLDPRKEGSWAQEKDIDRRRFPAQDIDMRVFDPEHPAHGKTKNEHPEFEPISDEEIPLPSEDKDERTRNPVQQDRDDRVRVPQMASNTNETKLPLPPLKSILKTRKPVPLDSPLSPEPSEKCGNDSKVKTDGEETTKCEEKETDDVDVDVKEESEKEMDSMYSPVSDSPDDVLAEDAPPKDVDQQSVEKAKSKKKTKKKKKKAKGEAEVVVEVSAFEENLQIKPPIFNKKKKQPLMDMDERRNSTDNEAGDVLPAPFREADDIGDLFPSGGDRDERRGHESSGDSSKEAPPSSPKRKAQDEGHSRENIAASDQFKEAHPRDTRVSKGPADVDHRPPGDGYRKGFPERDQRSHSYRGRHPNELPSREGVFREPPPRDFAFHEGSPRESLLRDRSPRSPTRENEPWGDPRLGPIREDRFGEGPDRDGSPREGPFREGPPREDHSRDYPPRDGPFREGPPREVQFRGPPREGPFREGSFREGPSREGPFRGPPRDDQFRESPPREGPFREGPPKEGSFREGPPREGSFREGPPREGSFREGPPREGSFREGPPREVPFREGAPGEGSFRGPSREGLFREGPPREGPFREGLPRDGPFREGPPRDGSFREGPPREGLFRDGPPREGSFREGPPRDGPFWEGPPREGSFREGPPREGSIREGPQREGSFRDGPPREGSFRDVHPRDLRGHPRGPYREENEFRDGYQREGPFREGSRREEPFWDDRPREGYARGSLPPRTGHFREFPLGEGPPKDAPPRRSPPGDQFRGPPGPLEERRDGPTHDMRERRFPGAPDEAGPRPMMEHDPAQGPPPDRRGEEQRGMPAPPDLSKPQPMGDKDERQPRQFNENAPMRHPPLQPIPDRPNMEVTLLPPHLQGPPRLPSMHPGHPVLGMAPLTMVPVQALPQVSGVGHIPTSTMLQGTALPPQSMPGPHLMNVSQPGQVLVLQGPQRPVFMPPHHLPPGFQPLIRPGLELRSQFDPSIPPPGFPQVLPVHLRPENPQGTPPQQQAGPFDINSLFAKLVATGILPPTRSDSPALPGTGTPPPTTAAPESTQSEELVPGDHLFVPEIGLYPEELKCRYQGVINRIYTGAQCSSCGMRYVIDDMDRYRKHLDWHFRQNRRDKDGVKAVQNRRWFYDVDEWLDFEEINEVDEEKSNFFEEQALESQVDKDGVQCVAVDANLEGDEMCKLCHEPFEQFFDEDEEVWMLKDALRFKNRTYHPSCYEDAKESALLETPTPGEEGLNSSFESITSSPLSAYAQRKMAKSGQTGQSSDSSKEEPNEPVAKPQSLNPVEDSKIALIENSGLALDQPKVDTNQQTASTKVGLPSTDQSVDPQKDTILSTESPVDAKSQIVDSAQIIKAETGGALETKPQLVTNTSSSAEIQKSIKQEHTADDASVKTETLVSPAVKMEVDESTIAKASKQSQDLAPEEKMELSDSVTVKQESEPVDSVQPMDTLEGVSSADANLKREASNDQLPETKLKSEVDKTNAQASSKQEHTSSQPLMPTTNPVEVAKQEQTGLEPLAPESSKTDSGKTETESLNPHPKAEKASSEIEKEDGATSLGQDETSSQQAKSEIIPETEPSQSETGSQDGGNVEQKPSQETLADGDANSTPTTTAATASEVQNIQAISVIGRSRMEARRRDMFFR